MRRLLRDERASALVEFALVVPLLLALVLGIIEFGRAWNIDHVITDAAREGARRAVVRVENQATKVGTAAAPGTVPQVIMQRLGSAGVQAAGSWDPATQYQADCSGWTLPATTVTQTVIYGCGWGDSTGEEAWVVIRTPYPFSFLGPVLRLVGGNMNAAQMSTQFVMRNE